MLSASRQHAINQLVTVHGAVNVIELAQRFQVSTSTIRRDLEQLESQGALQRIHGGATAPMGSEALNLVPAWGRQRRERIGRAAAARIQLDETVFLGPGELTLEVARAISQRDRVVVVTNGLDVAHWLATHSRLTVILTGGMVAARGARNGLVGPLVTAAMRSMRADRVIIEAVGVSPDQGLMAADPSQAELGRKLMDSPAETVVLVAPERVGRVGGIVMAGASSADVIITGREAPDVALWDLSQLGITVISV